VCFKWSVFDPESAAALTGACSSAARHATQRKSLVAVQGLWATQYPSIQVEMQFFATANINRFC
jgi:hypothetical protein